MGILGDAKSKAKSKFEETTKPAKDVIDKGKRVKGDIDAKIEPDGVMFAASYMGTWLFEGIVAPLKSMQSLITRMSISKDKDKIVSNAGFLLFVLSWVPVMICWRYGRASGISYPLAAVIAWVLIYFVGTRKNSTDLEEVILSCENAVILDAQARQQQDRYDEGLEEPEEVEKIDANWDADDAVLRDVILEQAESLLKTGVKRVGSMQEVMQEDMQRLIQKDESPELDMDKPIGKVGFAAQQSKALQDKLAQIRMLNVIARRSDSEELDDDENEDENGISKPESDDLVFNSFSVDGLNSKETGVKNESEPERINSVESKKPIKRPVKKVAEKSIVSKEDPFGDLLSDFAMDVMMSESIADSDTNVDSSVKKKSEERLSKAVDKEATKEVTEVDKSALLNRFKSEVSLVIEGENSANTENKLDGYTDGKPGKMTPDEILDKLGKSAVRTPRPTNAVKKVEMKTPSVAADGKQNLSKEDLIKKLTTLDALLASMDKENKK